MKEKKKIFVSIGLFLYFPYIAMAQADLTKEQLIRLMEASKGRYVSIAAFIIYRDYSLSENLTKLEQVTEQTCLEEKTSDYLYLEVNTSLFSGRKMDEKTLYYLSPDYEKKVVITPDSQIGMLSPSSRPLEPFYNLHRALWGLVAYPWEELWEQMGKATLSFDKDKHVYVYEYPIHNEQNSPWLRIFVAPDKEFVPVMLEVLFADKRLYLRQENQNFTKVNGLWVPLLYTFTEFKRLIMSEYTVEHVEVNGPLDSQARDFKFPEGLWVEDRIRGVEYRVPSKKSPLESSEQKTTGDCQKVCLPPPATDEQLAEAAAKAQTLLELVGIPGRVIIDHQVSPLKVNAFAGSIGGHQHLHCFVLQKFMLSLTPPVPLPCCRGWQSPPLNVPADRQSAPAGREECPCAP